MNFKRHNLRQSLACVGALLVSLFTAATAHSAPAIAVFPSSLTFTGQVYSVIAPQTIIVSNSGDTDLTYAITSDVFWLSANSPSGTLAAGQAATHSINVDTRGLDARSWSPYMGRVSIGGPSASNSPQSVVVSLPLQRRPVASVITAWGRNNTGQTNVPVGLYDAVSLAGGVSHSMALRANGSLSVWGTNNHGQLTLPASLADVVDIASGFDHCLAIRSDGTVVAWGDNGRGQIDIPSSATNVISVRGGSEFSLALRSDGTVVGWGDNQYGQVTIPSTLTNIVAIAAGGYHGLALRPNGTVAAWAYSGNGQTNIPAGLSDAVAIAAGREFSVVLRSNGTVMAWGDHSNGETNVPPGLINVIAISAGGDYAVALRSDGSIVAWGDNTYGQTNVPAGTGGYACVACGQTHALALTATDTVQLVVASDYGSPSPRIGSNPLVSNSLSLCTVASPVTLGGTQVFCSGWVGTGDVPGMGNSNQVSVTVTRASSITWLWGQTNYWLDVTVTGGGGISSTNDGWYASGGTATLSVTNLPERFIGWFGTTNGCTMAGTNIAVPMTSARNIEARFVSPAIALQPTSVTMTGQVGALLAGPNFVISNSGIATLNYTIAPDMFWLHSSASTGSLPSGQSSTNSIQVTTFGLAPRTYKGHLVITSPEASNSPKSVLVSAMLSRPVIKRSRVVTWGANTNGLLTPPTNLTNAVSVAAGYNFTVAMRSDGKVSAWGTNYFGATYGVTNVSASLTNAKSISAGWYHALAIRSDGTAVSWGYSGGSTNIPSELTTNAWAVAAGRYHSLGLTESGTVLSWGDNNYGQTNRPTGLNSNVFVDISGGFYHSMALRSDGSVVAWGTNYYGETNVPAGLSNVVAVSAGGYCSMALRADGGIVAWGYGGFGQTNIPAGLTNAVAVSCGFQHAMALRADGTVVAWGSNGYGQVNVPAGLKNVINFSAGTYHSVAIVTGLYQLVVSSARGSPSPGIGTNWVSEIVPLSCMVTSPLTAGTTQYVCIGWTGTGSLSSNGTSNVASCSLTNDSSITWRWSTNYWLDVVATNGGSVDTGDSWYPMGTSVALRASCDLGYVFKGWSGNTNGCTINDKRITVPMTSARQVEARFAASTPYAGPATLTFTGQVYSAIADQTLTITNAGATDLTYSCTSDMFWLKASSEGGTLSAGASTSVVVSVSTRGFDALTYIGHLTVDDPASTNDVPQNVPVTLKLSPVVTPSRVVAWGWNAYGQTNIPSGLTDTVAVAGSGGGTMVLRANGTITAFPTNGMRGFPSGVTDFVAMDFGDSPQIGLRANGTVVTWATGGVLPVPAGLTDIVSISAGWLHYAAVHGDGSVSIWIDGTNSVTAEEWKVPDDLTNAVSVAVGMSHNVALRANGTVLAWGANNFGQTNVPSGLSNVVAVSAGSHHSMALKSDGTVVTWGACDYSEPASAIPPAGLTDVVGIDSGEFHAMALRSNGTLVVWGYNGFGETNVPEEVTNVIGMAGGWLHSIALMPAQSLQVSSACGSPIPHVGTNWVTRNVEQHCSVAPLVSNGGTQYVNTGWIGTGSVPSTGNSNVVSFVITNDSSIAWLWGQTNYWLDVLVTGGGGISSTNDGWFTSGGTVTLSVTNSPELFIGWFGDTNGCTFNGTEIAVPITSARAIEARFVGPAIAHYPSTLLFTGQLYTAVSPQTLIVSNAGALPFTYTITPDVFWLSVPNPAGTLAAGMSTTHVVNVSALGMADDRAFPFWGSLTIKSDTATNSPQTVSAMFALGTPTNQRTRVITWGSNTNGQVTPPANLTNAVSVSAGNNFTMARCSDGRVVVWGINSLGVTNVPTGLTNATAISAGWNHCLAKRTDGMVVSWGNSGGSTNVPGNLLSNAMAIAAGGTHSLGVTELGKLVTWGDNTYGQTNLPAGLTSNYSFYVDVAGGAYHSLGLRIDGTVVAWGTNYYGETNVPAGLSNVVAISAGGYCSMALRADGRIVAWGYGGYGQTNIPADLTNAVAISCGFQNAMALRADGTVVSWGANGFGQVDVPVGLKNVVNISVGSYHSVAIVTGLYQLVVSSARGSPSPGIETNWISENVQQTYMVTSPVSFGATQYVNVGWIGSGSVPASSTSNAVAFTITNDSSITWLWQTNYELAVSADSNGTVNSTGGWYTSGSNVVITAIPNAGYGVLSWTGDTNDCVVSGPQIVVPMAQARSLQVQFVVVPSISLGTTSLVFTGQVYSAIAPQTLVVSNSGNADLNYTIVSDMFWLSVSNASGTLAAGQVTTHVVRVATRGLNARQYQGHLVVADTNATSSSQATDVSLVMTGVVPPSKVIVWGSNDFGVMDIPTALTDVVAVETGIGHAIALRADGTVISWGLNSYGQTNVPTDLTNAVAVAGGLLHSLALRANGTVVAWGCNINGQTDDIPIGLTNAVAVAAGSDASLALRGDGTIVAWGLTNFDVTGLSNVVAITAGGNFVLALHANGTVTATGWNDYGQINLPAELTNVVAVAAGQFHSLALKSDGTVVAWGRNDFGQADVPMGLTNVVAVAAGFKHSLALRADGSLIAWGMNSDGQTNVPPGLANVITMAGGSGFSLALVPAQALIVSSTFPGAIPGVGTNWVIRGAEQACSVDFIVTAGGGTQYVNTGWIGTGSTPASGTSNNVSFLITNNSSLTWLWQTNYWLGSGTNGSGSVVPTSGWFVAGSAVTITAAPSEYWHFSIWSGDMDSEVATSAVVTLGMTMPLSVMAEFVINRTSNDVPETWLAEHGITNNFNDAETNDPDGDGMTTLEEYIADLDPMSATSSFVIATTSSTNGFAISIPSSTGRVYSLDSITNLLSPYWRSISDQTDVPGNGGTLTLTTTNAGGRRVYYRVRVALP